MEQELSLHCSMQSDGQQIIQPRTFTMVMMVIVYTCDELSCSEERHVMVQMMLTFKTYQYLGRYP